MPYDAGAFCTRAEGDICLDAKRWRRLLMNNGYDRWRILTPFIVYSPEELHMWLLTGLHYWCVGVVTGVVEGAKILANALVLLLELVAVMVVMAEAFRRRRRSRTTLLSPFLSQVRSPSLSAHRFLQPYFHAKIGNLKVFLSYKVGPKTATSSFSSS